MSSTTLHEPSAPQDHDPAHERKRSALLRVLKATLVVSSQAVYYASALGAIALMAGAGLPPAIATIVGTIGVNTLSNILERIAEGEDVSDDEIRRQVQIAITESGIERPLTEKEFYHAVAHVIRQQNILSYAVNQNELAIATLLEEEIGQHEAVMDELQAISSQLPTLATRQQSDRILARLDTIDKTDEIKQELVTVKERYLQEQWDLLRAEANAGYKEGIRSKVARLVEEMENLAKSTSLDLELQGRVYRLAASTFLPDTFGGDVEQCRAYLAKARRFSTSDDAFVQCQIMNASLAHRTRGSDVALALMQGVEGGEAERFRFSLYLDTNNWNACSTLLHDLDESELWKTKDWVRLLAIYYAATGDQASLEQALTNLLSGTIHADHYLIAGLALARVAHRQLQAFCDAHNISPELHLGLELDELVDTDATRHASEMFAKASEFYQQKSCTRHAVEALLSAIRLEIDIPPSEQRRLLLEQLQKISPDHPLLLGVRSRSLPGGQSDLIEQLRAFLADIDPNPFTILSLAETASQTREIAAAATDLLQQNYTLFIANDVAFAHYLLTLSLLRKRAGLDPEPIVEILETRRPERYLHYWPLLHFIAIAEHDPQRASDWLEEALRDYPDNPEVLATATNFFKSQRAHDRRLECAQNLHGIVRTSQTAELLLNALLAVKRYESFLQLVDQVADLPLDEKRLRSGRAYAHIRLNQPLLAREHLEWLRAQNAATMEDLLNLARIYQYVGQQAAAFDVLHTCVQRYSDEADAYLELSQAYLFAGQRDESFKWALRARNRFPDDANVATYFLMTSYPTGFDLRPEVGAAFREFVAGGRFEESGYIAPYRLEELVTFLKSSQEHAAYLESLYQEGKISSMMLCYGQDSPLFRFHYVGTRLRLPRFVAAGDQEYEATWLKQQNPQEVVLDYTAILTLWSLYSDRWIDVLRQSFQQVWIPSSLLQILLWEQQQMVKRGQPSYHKARTAIRDAVDRNTAKFHVHPRKDPLDQWDHTGTYTETTVAIERGLPYLNEYLHDNERGMASVIGLRLIADVLAKDGEITRDVQNRLTEHAHSSAENELVLISRISRGSSLVIDIITFTQIALAGALQPFCDYFKEIHLSEPAWQHLQREIADFDYNDQMAQDLRNLRAALGDAIQAGFVLLDSTSPEKRWLSRRFLTSDDSTDEASATVDEIKQLMFEFLEDLLSIANFRNIPIWADDRWTSKLYPDECKPPFIFGTDQFLEWVRLKHSNDDECFDKYGQLIRWSYLGLPLNPNHILWHITQGMRPAARVFTEALTSSRDFMVNFWKSAQSSDAISTEFGVRLLTLYNQATVALLRRCFERKVSLDICAEIFRLLDMTRFAPQTEGREPLFFASLLLNVTQLSQTDLTDEVSARSIVSFSRWFDRIAQASRVIPEVLEEAWYGLLQQPVAMYEAATTEQEKLVAFIFTKRFMDAAPEYIRTYLLNGDLGGKLRQAFGLRQEVLTVIDVASPEGKSRIAIPEETWAPDLHTATTQYVTSDEPQSPITVGTVTVRAEWFSQGSIFLWREEIPSEVYRVHSDARGRRSGVCILSAAISDSAAERLAFWRQGLRKLQSLGLPTEDWEALHQSVESSLAEAGVEIGKRLQRSLLSKLAVIQDYFAEAAQIGAEAVITLLDHIEPNMVRGWLMMPQLGWETEGNLTAWSKSLMEQLLSSTDSPMATVMRQLDHYVPYGYSIFSDALIWQDSVADVLTKCSDEDLQPVLARLLDLGDKTASMPLKANTLVSLFRVIELRSLEPDSETSERVQQLIRVVTVGGRLQEGEVVYSSLERVMCEYLYTSWRSEASSRTLSPRELGYLAYVASGVIVDALARSGALSQESIHDFMSRLQLTVHQLRMADSVMVQQPTGLFKPRWGQYLNYPLAYLLGSAESDNLSLGKAPIDITTRSALLDAGLGHRVAQAYMQTSSLERDWLDSSLIADIGQSISGMLSESFEEHPETWSEEEKVKLGFCTEPEHGITTIVANLARLPSADEQDVLQIVGLSFLAAPFWSEGSYLVVQALLNPGALEHVGRFPMAYGELIWRLIDLLAANQVLPPDLETRAREITFGVLADIGNAGDLLEFQARVLSQVVGFGQYIGEVKAWLRSLITDDRISVGDVRRCIRPFIQVWPHYDESVRQGIGTALLEVANNPRVSHLWEFQRIRRDMDYTSTRE